MYLVIQQDNSIAKQENISSETFNYLYNLVNTNQLDNNSSLVGNLCVPGTYLAYIDKLMEDFPDLNITADKLYVPFVDPEFGRIMIEYVSSDGVGCTTNEISQITMISRSSAAGTLSRQLGDAFHSNTTLTSLKDLLKTRITSLSGDNYMWCSNVTELGIPSTVTSIGRQVLYLDNSLNKVIVEDIDSFCGISSYNTNIFDFGNGCDLYTIQNGLDIKVTELELSRNITVLGLFKNCKSLESVVVSNGVTRIANKTFQNCKNIESVVLPNSLEQIGNYAFEGCSNLTTVNFPNSLTYIGDNSFSGCPLPSLIDLSNTQITWATARMFTNSNLTSIKFPATLTQYGTYSNASPISSRAITEIRGLDNVTTLHGFVYGNINHAINMSALEISDGALIRSTTDSGNISSSAPQLYMKSFKYSSNTKYENIWGRVGYSMFCYRTNENNALTQIGLMYFKDLEKVHNFQFYGARFKNLVINRTTPPVLDNTGITYNLVESIGNGTTWQSNLFGTIPTTGNDAMIIYVPDSAVATYLADSNYNSYTIRGINEVDPNTNTPYLTRYATNELWEAAGKPTDALIEEYM